MQFVSGSMRPARKDASGDSMPWIEPSMLE